MPRSPHTGSSELAPLVAPCGAGGRVRAWQETTSATRYHLAPLGMLACDDRTLHPSFRPEGEGVREGPLGHGPLAARGDAGRPVIGTSFTGAYDPKVAAETERALEAWRPGDFDRADRCLGPAARVSRVANGSTAQVAPHSIEGHAVELAPGVSPDEELLCRLLRGAHGAARAAEERPDHERDGHGPHEPPDPHAPHPRRHGVNRPWGRRCGRAAPRPGGRLCLGCFGVLSCRLGGCCLGDGVVPTGPCSRATPTARGRAGSVLVVGPE